MLNQSDGRRQSGWQLLINKIKKILMIYALWLAHFKMLGPFNVVNRKSP